MAALNEWFPTSISFKAVKARNQMGSRGYGFFVLAITIRNAPEGLALDVGFGVCDMAAGTALAIGIGLQNASGGLAVAVALLSCGYSRTRSFAVAEPTGLVEPIAGFFGAYAVSLSHLVLPGALTFCRWSDDLCRQPRNHP